MEHLGWVNINKIKSNIWNKTKVSLMVFNCPKAATQQHSKNKIAVFWCYNDDLEQGNNS